MRSIEQMSEKLLPCTFQFNCSTLQLLTSCEAILPSFILIRCVTPGPGLLVWISAVVLRQVCIWCRSWCIVTAVGLRCLGIPFLTSVPWSGCTFRSAVFLIGFTFRRPIPGTCFFGICATWRNGQLTVSKVIAPTMVKWAKPHFLKKLANFKNLKRQISSFWYSPEWKGQY